jgi:hypothetical protein
MKYKVTKLDKRHNGYTWYKYYINPESRDFWQSRAEVTEIRNWFWATYGPASELGWNAKGDIWAWDTEHGNKRIYLKSDEELTLFTLKFGG